MTPRAVFLAVFYFISPLPGGENLPPRQLVIPVQAQKYFIDRHDEALGSSLTIKTRQARRDVDMIYV